MTTSLTFETDRVRQLDIHVLPTPKFKTITVVMNIQQDLREETATKAALLSLVLKRASEKYPTSQAMRRYLDSLYGTVFETDVIKKGERQIIQFYLEVANEQFLADQTPLFARGIEFLGDVLTSPLVDGNAFSSKVVDMEKETLKKKLDSLIDDKIRYANQRATEEMCQDEPYRLMAYGQKEKVDAITPEELYSYYRELLAQNPVDIYVVGDVDPDAVKREIDRHLTPERGEPVALSPTLVQVPVDEVKVVTDRLNVTQGKLNMGCRTGTSYGDDDYIHLLMYNGILGGFPHSKLFINVREKASLAYYAASRLESHKGILMIMSGIEISNYGKAVDIIKEQLQLMKNGTITEQELNQTKAMLTNQLRETLDNARTMIDFAYNGRISGRNRTLEDILQDIKNTKIEDIQKIARKIHLDTIYFLRDREGQ